MVFTNTGKNRVRDLLDADLNYGELGTDNSAELVSNTNLGAADAATSVLLTTTTADKQINIDYNLPSTTGGGTTYTEFGTFNTSDTIFSRNVFASLTKTSTEQWQISVSYKIL